MSDYTPTTSGVRLDYATAGGGGGFREDWAVGFDRWLAAHDREVAARALADPTADEIEDAASRPCRDVDIVDVHTIITAFLTARRGAE